MKLKHYLETLDGNEIVSIGTENGHSYMYIGEAGNVELVSSLFETYRDTVVKNLSRLESKERGLVLNIPDEEEISIHEYAKTIANVYMRIEKHRSYLDTYVEPLKRKVVITENRECEEGIKVIIKGNEKGNYWFKSEFDKMNG